MDKSTRQELLEITKGFKAYLQFERDVLGRTLVPEGKLDEKRGLSNPMGRRTTLEDVRTELGECTRCPLHRSRTHIVFGEGNPRAKLMFVGEGPGRDEDIQGRPFVGQAGGLLTKIIEAIKLTRSDVYIANIVKCRPPENRAPVGVEISTCFPFLVKQIRVIGPRLIVALGTVAAQTLLKTHEPISKSRGRFHDFDGIPVMPTFHPAYLLRNPGMKRPVWRDMQMVQKTYNEVE